MQITDLTLRNVRWPLPPGGRSTLGLVTIETSEGITGHSFLGTTWRGAQFDAPFLLEVAKPLLLGRDPSDISALWYAMRQARREFSVRAIGAVDVALWDIAGKVSGLPVYKLLGAARNGVPAYASTGGLAGPEAYAEEARKLRDEGWPAYKIHPPREPNADIEIARAVRKAVGDDMSLMLDPVSAYSYEDGVRVGRVLDELDYEWFEDPLADANIYGYRKLRQTIRTPIMATEYAPGGFDSMHEWILQGATDILRGDVTVKGGITPLMKIAHLAEAFRMNCEIHHGGNALANLANLHVTLAIGNCRYYEVIVNDTSGRYGLTEYVEVKSGVVRAPETPGLGAKIDFDLLENETESVLE